MAFTLTAAIKLTPPTNLNQIANQIQNRLKNIQANVNVNLPKGAAGQLNNINSQMRNVASSAKNASNFMQEFGKSAAASVRRYAGFTIFASSFYALTKAIKGSIDEAISFQRELVKIRQVSGVSLKDLKGLTDEITHLSTSFGVSSKKLLNSSQILAQAGLSIKDISKAASTLAKIELAPTFDDVTDATEGMIAIMGQFGTTADKLEAQFGAINSVSAKFAVESSDIITAVRRTGGAFAAAGGSLNELIALFTSVRQTSRESAETIATGFRTIFTRIQRTRTVDFLEKLGINLHDDVTKQFVGPYEAIKKLSAALRSIPSTDARFAQITEELGGFRQIGKVIPLIQKNVIAEQALIVAKRGENSLTEDAIKAQDAFSIKLQKVQEEYQALIRTVSDNSVFKKMVDDALLLGSALAKLTGSLEKILPLLLAAGAAKIGIAGFQASKTFLPGIGLNSTSSKQQAAIGVGAIALPTVLDSLGLLNNETRDLASSFQTFGGIFLGLTTVMRTFSDVIHKNQEKLSVLKPQSSTLKSQILGGEAIGDSLRKDLRRSKNNNSILDSQITARKNNILTNQALINYSNASPASKAKAQAEVTIDTIKLKRQTRERKAGELEENDIRQRVSAERLIYLAKSKELAQIDKEIKSLEKAERTLDVFNVGLAAATGAAIAFGQNLEKNAGIQLRAGVNAKGSFASGRAASIGGFGAAGAGLAGAQIGALSGPQGAVIGGAIGVVLGGLVGSIKGYTDGIKEAQDILDKANFDKSFTKFDQFLKNVSAGKTNINGGVAQFRSGVNLLQNRLANSSLGDKESAEGAIQNSIVGIQQFLDEIAKTVDSFDELQNKVGTDVIQTFAQFINLPFSKVKEEFENQIKSQKDLIKQNNILTKAQEGQLKQIQSFNKLNGVLQDSIDSLSSFSEVLESTKIKDLSSVLGRPETSVDKNLFAKAVAQAVNPLGSRGKAIGNQVLQTSEVLSQLEDVFIQATKKPFGETKDLIDDFEDSLVAKFPDIGDALKNSLTANLTKIRGSESKDSRVLQEFNDNPTQFFKNLTDGIVEAEKEFIVELSKITTQQLNDLASLYDKRRQIESKLIDGINKTINLSEQKANFNFEARGKRVPLSVGEEFDKNRLAAATGNGFSTVGGLSSSADSSQSKILELNQILQNEVVNRQAVLDELENEKDILAKAVRGLEFFADATARNAHLQKELELEQKRSNSKFDFAKSFTFGDLDSRRGLAKGALAGGLLARNNDISKVPGDLRGGALSFLEGFDETPLAFLGGKSGRDVIRGTIEKNLIGAGLSEDEAKKVALNKTTPAEEKLIAAINDNFNKSIDAQKTLNELLSTTEVAILEDIRENTAKFNILLERNFVTAEKGKVQSEVTGVAGKIANLQSQGKTFGDIQGIIGGGADRFNNVKAALPQLDALAKNDKSLTDRRNRLTQYSSLANDANSNYSLLGKLQGGLKTSDFRSLNDTLGKDKFNEIKNKFKKDFGEESANDIFNSDFLKQFDVDSGSKRDFLNIFRNRVKSVRGGISTDTESHESEKQRLLSQTGIENLGELFRVAENASKLTDLFKSIPEGATFDQLSNFNVQVGQAARELESLRGVIFNLGAKENTLNDSLKRAGGGFVPGFGSGDVVPAMLTPGEFVIRKDAAEAIGYDTLHDMNRQGFASGGRAKRLSYAARKQARHDAYTKRNGATSAAGIRAAKYHATRAANAAKRLEFQESQVSGSIAGKGKIGAEAAKEHNRRTAESLEKIRSQNPDVQYSKLIQSQADGKKLAKEIEKLRNGLNNKPAARAGIGVGAALGVIGAGAGGFRDLLDRREDKGKNLLVKPVDRLDGPNDKATLLKHSKLPMGLYKSGSHYYHVASNGVVGTMSQPIDDAANPGFVRFQGEQLNLTQRKNKGIPIVSPDALGYNKGGKVKQRFAGGGAVKGGNSGISSEAISGLSRFVDGISKLTSSLDSFPRSIEMNCRHTVEVIHNGAQVFESLNSNLVSLVEATVGREINRMIKNKFPEVGAHE